MVKHRKSACKATSKVIGNNVTVKVRCPIKTKVVKTPCKSRKKTKVHRVPSECKGLKGRSLTECKRILHKKYAQ